MFLVGLITRTYQLKENVRKHFLIKYQQWYNVKHTYVIRLLKKYLGWSMGYDHKWLYIICLCKWCKVWKKCYEWKLLVSPCQLSTNVANSVWSRNENPVLASPHIHVALIVWSHHFSLVGTRLFKVASFFPLLTMHNASRFYKTINITYLSNNYTMYKQVKQFNYIYTFN
jgi:hypothetical protein